MSTRLDTRTDTGEGAGTGGGSDVGTFKAAEAPKARESGPLHPWEFDYKRDKHPAHPYWHGAALAKDPHHPHSHPHPPPLSTRRPAAGGGGELSSEERGALLSQYEPKVLSACSKCYDAFAPAWGEVRNELARAQVPSKKGTMVSTKFVTALHLLGAQLSKSEVGCLVRGFRGLGLQEVVNHDEFLRVCLLVKGSCK